MYVCVCVCVCVCIPPVHVDAIGLVNEGEIITIFRRAPERELAEILKSQCPRAFTTSRHYTEFVLAYVVKSNLYI